MWSKDENLTMGHRLLCWTVSPEDQLKQSFRLIASRQFTISLNDTKAQSQRIGLWTGSWSILKSGDSAKAELVRARLHNWDDFEDAVTAAVAEATGCHYIVTRDFSGFQKSPTRFLSPEEYLAIAKKP